MCVYILYFTIPIHDGHGMLFGIQVTAKHKVHFDTPPVRVCIIYILLCVGINTIMESK